MIHICNWQKKLILLPILVWFLILKKRETYMHSGILDSLGYFPLVGIDSIWNDIRVITDSFVNP